MKVLKETDGFTIQEILVVLIVGSILVSMSFALFQFTNELFQRWNGSTEMKGDVRRILTLMAMDIQKTSSGVSLTDTSLVLTREFDKEIRYDFVKSSDLDKRWRISRNGVDITPQKAKVFLVKVREEVRGMNSVQYRISILAESRWANCQYEIVATTTPSSKSDFYVKR
ncbi:MAG TPA: hypothetical protein PK595_02065 [Bacteroidota bacterium]|nr:hypothetical protein [Bacteroidota bacterium]